MSLFWFLPARPHSPTPWEFPDLLPKAQIRYLTPPTERGCAGPGASRSPAAQLRAPKSLSLPPPPLEPHTGTHVGLPPWLEPVTPGGLSSGPSTPCAFACPVCTYSQSQTSRVLQFYFPSHRMCFSILLVFFLAFRLPPQMPFWPLQQAYPC